MQAHMRDVYIVQMDKKIEDENIDNILNFKISNFNSKTENNNQITQVVDYGGKIKPMMIEFVNSYIKKI